MRISPNRPGRLVALGDHGKLLTRTGSELAVRVADRAGEVLVLARTLLGAASLRAEEPEDMLLECACAHGLARFRGEAELEPAGIVRFHVSEVVEIVQRRQFFRVDAHQRVELAAQRGRLQSHSIDISGGGMLLAAPDSLSLGEEVELKLYLAADDDPVVAGAEVVRITADGRPAIIYDRIENEERERLIHYLFDWQRVTLAGGRHGYANEEAG